MRIYIDDLIFSLQKTGGISVYWGELMKRFKQLPANTVQCVEFHRQYNVTAETIPSFPHHIREQLPAPNIIKRFLPLLAHLSARGIYHSSYLKWSLQKNIANIITIHDLAPELAMIHGIKRHIRKIHQRTAIRQADGIICVSETTKKALLTYYPDTDPDCITVIHHGISDNFRPIEKDKSPNQPYILFVGNRDGYKNFRFAIDIVRHLPHIRIILIGGKSINPEELRLLNKTLPGRFEHQPAVSEASLNYLYNHAYCLLYPSQYEGFGMPILEAMKAGCPVVTSDKGSIPEIAGNAAILVKNQSLEAYLQAIKSLEDINARTHLIHQGILQAQNYSWNTCFNQHLDFYRKIYLKKFGNDIIIQKTPAEPNRV